MSLQGGQSPESLRAIEFVLYPDGTGEPCQILNRRATGSDLHIDVSPGTVRRDLDGINPGGRRWLPGGRWW